MFLFFWSSEAEVWNADDPLQQRFLRVGLRSKGVQNKLMCFPSMNFTTSVLSSRLDVFFSPIIKTSYLMKMHKRVFLRWPSFKKKWYCLFFCIGINERWNRLFYSHLKIYLTLNPEYFLQNTYCKILHFIFSRFQKIFFSPVEFCQNLNWVSCLQCDCNRFQ